eukprot:TRINITY_DN1297_c0_g1_i6.p1 TRINITY_DN1297_c0_g1~~TRINITY_DN1297_c0_g1_i6.p1  ORF type:complete len:433 (+),score=117.45 TRINITY_DN1297_c0_g1_i6:189-1487(+)
MGLPELKSGGQAAEQLMPDSIRAQWKNLPTAFLPQSERRQAPEGGYLEPMEEQDYEEEDKQTVCIQTLVAGNCKAYIELFYLSHMANAEAEEDPSDKGEGKDEESGPRQVTTDSVANNHLPLLRELLTTAENAARANEAMHCYEANQQIAELFEDGEAWEASQTYYEKCLRISKDCGNSEGEAGAYCRLGQLHESAGNNELALEHHEKYLGLANASGMEDESSEALKSLVGTYMIRAEEMEAQGEQEKAVEYYECCIRSAQECYDAHSEGIANHRLGKLWLDLGETVKSISHQKAYLEYCKSVSPEDQEGIVAASASLADAYHTAGDVDEAVSNLRLCLEIAEATQSLEAQTQACNNLGLIYMKQDNFVKAVECFQRNFEIACSIGGKALIDNAKVNLGVAKGKSKMGKFMDLVCKDLPSLIQWKNNRTKLT